jgi:hypothetical protein
MESYHIRTSEPDKHDPPGLESFTLDSIYVPDRKVLVGFIKWSDMRGKILNYSEIHHERAQAIVEGNKNGVEGDIISKIDLKNNTIDQIASNVHESEIYTTREYDNSTDVLVGILSGELR